MRDLQLGVRGSYLRLIDVCITRLESNKEEEGQGSGAAGHLQLLRGLSQRLLPVLLLLAVLLLRENVRERVAEIESERRRVRECV